MRIELGDVPYQDIGSGRREHTNLFVPLRDDVYPIDVVVTPVDRKQPRNPHLLVPLHRREHLQGRIV